MTREKLGKADNGLVVYRNILTTDHLPSQDACLNLFGAESL
jgi:hypothetical protein